jgi:hypothetical protein
VVGAARALIVDSKPATDPQIRNPSAKTPAGISSLSASIALDRIFRQRLRED